MRLADRVCHGDSNVCCAFSRFRILRFLLRLPQLATSGSRKYKVLVVTVLCRLYASIASSSPPSALACVTAALALRSFSPSRLLYSRKRAFSLDSAVP